MAFKDELKQRFPSLYPPTQNKYAHQSMPPGFPPQPAPGVIVPITSVPAGVPVPAVIEPVPSSVVQLQATVEKFLPMIENLTGLTRREIFLHLLKTGIKGGSVDSLISGLLGQRPVVEAKFIRYVKIAAIWVPVFVFLMGSAVVGVFLLLKLVMILMGGL